MNKKIWVILCMCFMANAGRSQNIHFTTTQFPAFTLTPGNDIALRDSLYFSGTTSSSFHGVVHFYARVNSDSLGGVDSTRALVLDTASHRYDTATIIIPITPNFVIGTNGVVIWPIYSGGQAGSQDSIRFTVNVYHAGIDESPLARIYIYQQDELMFLNFGNAENLIQKVRFYDIQSREIYSDTADKSRKITTATWQPGIYLCEITTISGQRKVIKLKVDK